MLIQAFINWLRKKKIRSPGICFILSTPYNEQQHHLRGTVTDIPFREVWVASQVVLKPVGFNMKTFRLWIQVYTFKDSSGADFSTQTFSARRGQRGRTAASRQEEN